MPRSGASRAHGSTGSTRAGVNPADDRSVHWRPFLVIFLVALAYRALYLFEASRLPSFSLFYMDQEYHLEWAKAIASGVWAPPYSLLRNSAFFRAPLYPHLLAGLFKLTGPNPLVARLVQILIGSLSCSLAYALATKLLGRRVGILTGVFCALYWVLAYFDGELLMPVLLVFLVLCAFLLAFLAVERASPVLSGLSGLAYGLYAIGRPNILAFIPLAVLWMAREARREGGRRGLLMALLFAVLCALPPTAVTLRNRAVSGDWVVVASQGGVNFYIGNNPESDGMQAVVPSTRQTWWGGYENTIAMAEEAVGRSLGPSEVSGYWFGRALDYVRGNPGDWLRLTGRKALAHIGDVELPNNEPYEARRGRYWTLRAVPLSFAPLFALFLVALPAMLRFGRLPARMREKRCGLPQRMVRLILLFSLVYSLTVVAFFVTGRYRVPILPFVVTGAATALVMLWDALRSRQSLRVAVMLAAAVLLTGLLHVDWFDVRRSTRGFARLSEAHDRLETGDFDGAIEVLTSVSGDGSVDAPEVYNSLIRARIGRNAPGDRQAVLETAEEGLRHHPSDPELLWYASAGRVSLQDWEAASRHLSGYLALRPDDPRALFMAAAAAYEQGDLVNADAWLTRAEALDGSNSLVLGLRQQLESASSQK